MRRPRLPLKTPTWWYKPISWLAICLLPFSWLYRLGNFCHISFTVPKAGVLPVVCVGGLTAGGSGKTPATIAIADMLTAQGHHVVCLNSGYSGKYRGPIWVNASHSYIDVGDEALELAAHHRTIISRNRHQGIALAKQGGATVVVMDDGLQHYALLADINIATLDSTEALGNGLLIPAGPLREPITQAAQRLDAVLGIGEHAVPAIVPTVFQAKAQFHSLDHTKRYIAFCGIGTPEKFFRSLRQTGANVIQEIAFPDHYAYTNSDTTCLQRLAIKNEATLITTRKDWVRLPKHVQKNVTYLPLTLVFENAATITAWLIHHLPPPTT